MHACMYACMHVCMYVSENRVSLKSTGELSFSPYVPYSMSIFQWATDVPSTPHRGAVWAADSPETTAAGTPMPCEADSGLII